MKKGNIKKKLRRPRCADCGETLMEFDPSPNPSMTKVCKACKKLQPVKDSWQPLGSGHIARIMVVDSKKGVRRTRNLTSETQEFKIPQ